MRLSGSMRPIVFAFILAIGITISLPYLAFGAAHSFGNSGRFKVSRMHRQHSISQPFHRFGFFDVNGVDEQQVIIIQQFSPAVAPEPREPATTRIYVPPRWGVSSGGLTARILDRPEARGRALTTDSFYEIRFHKSSTCIELHNPAF
jgi:hypothetical protein